MVQCTLLPKLPVVPCGLSSDMLMFDDVIGGGAAGESPAEALGLCGLTY